jgi:protein-tyrosine phosphatase
MHLGATLLTLHRRLSLRFATGWAMRRARVTSLERIHRSDCQRLLVLCYGNIYRSPLAAACLGRELYGRDDLEIRSAGFHSREGRPTRDDFIRQVHARVDLDLSGHRSAVVRRSDIQWADTIVIMDRHNWHALARLSKDGLDKVTWLGAFLDTDSVEIVDPYGLPESEVSLVIDRLVAAATGMADQITSGRR